MKEVSQVDCLIYLAGNNCVNKQGCPFSRYFKRQRDGPLFLRYHHNGQVRFRSSGILTWFVPEERHSNKSIRFRQAMIRNGRIAKGG